MHAPTLNVVVLENSVELRRPRADVFDYCSDIRNEREWNATMRSVELLTPGSLRAGSVYCARWKGGPTRSSASRSTGPAAGSTPG